MALIIAALLFALIWVFVFILPDDPYGHDGQER